ncbi:hypothetical protein NL676_001049 [Syzygium grande]|nr:hypothetical protein NL676_001049 [Syzygium grande]
MAVHLTTTTVASPSLLASDHDCSFFEFLAFINVNYNFEQFSNEFVEVLMLDKAFLITPGGRIYVKGIGCISVNMCPRQHWRMQDFALTFDERHSFFPALCIGNDFHFCPGSLRK